MDVSAYPRSSARRRISRRQRFLQRWRIGGSRITNVSKFCIAVKLVSRQHAASISVNSGGIYRAPPHASRARGGEP